MSLESSCFWTTGKHNTTSHTLKPNTSSYCIMIFELKLFQMHINIAKWYWMPAPGHTVACQQLASTMPEDQRNFSKCAESPSVCDLALFNPFMLSVFFFIYESSEKYVTLPSIQSADDKCHYWNVKSLMSSVLLKLETNNINRLNRARSHTDGENIIRNNTNRIFFLQHNRNTNTLWMP